jgi:hypothetical protein
MLLGGDRLVGGERCGIRSSSQTQLSQGTDLAWWKGLCV